MKEDNYRQQHNILTKEIKQVTKEVYEWEKRAVHQGTQVEKMKERN